MSFQASGHILYVVYIGRRQHLLRDRLPTGLTPALTSSFGDCLFGAVSVCLFGNIEFEELLRLAAVMHGINHFDHYLEMVRITFKCDHPWSLIE